MKDLYSVLGVDRNASEAEIKTAYRKLAKALHPDQHKNDDKAAERFKEVSAAYGILGDKDKRRRYDRGEIDESGQERAPFGAGAGAGAAGAQGFGGFGGFRPGGSGGQAEFADAEDLFADLFGFGGRTRRARARKGRNVSYRLKIGFVDAVKGTTRRVTLSNGRTLDVKIPAGVQDGQQIRLSGQGESGEGGGPQGDALVTVQVSPHPYYRREGDDIHLDLPITLDEAVLGGKVTVPTVDGNVSLNIPKNASSGKRLRLKGRGVPGKSGRGDQYVTLKIVLPEAPDKKLEAAIADWAKERSQNPRAHMGV